MSSKSLVLAIALALTPLACGAAEDVGSAEPQSPHPVPPGSVRGPFVQAGTIFVVALDDAIDTFYTTPGTPFTATLVAPLSGEDGRVLVPRGAKVHGTLTSVGTRDTPTVRVDLQSIDTVAGRVPLRARVRSAEHYAWTGPPITEPSASYIYPYDFESYGSATTAEGAAPAGRPVEGMTMMQPREIRVPAGAQVVLQIVEPLLLPGAQLVH